MSEPIETSTPQCSIVALVGRPNVGKSTLFNRITRSRKAIVDPTPGVTRDRHYEKATWGDRSFILVDTGGLDAGGADSMVGSIRGQTMQAIEEADVIIFLLDAREGVTPADHDVAALLRKTAKPTFFVVNKIDGPELENTHLPLFYELGVDTLWPIAAEHGYGVNALLDEMILSFRLAEPGGELPDDTIRIAFFGRPNVGKSSLINRLSGEDRMVVSSLPGTTRDSVDTLFSTDKNSYLLIDTAGIRRMGKVREKLEKFSVMRALAALERCDIVLLLIDAEEGITEQDTKVIGYIHDSGRGCILVVNKWDLAAGDKKKQQHILREVEMATQFVGFAPVLTLSALTGSGTGRLFPTIRAVYKQYCGTFSTGSLNRLLQDATTSHPPSLHQGRRLKFYYTTQVTSRPPTFTIFVNYPKGVHFSYHRFLVNRFREGLKLDKCPVRIFFRERKRKKYG